jgi:UDP-glucose 4-epimerase
MRVLVTGATGFVGTELCRVLAGSGHVVRAAVRAPRPGSTPFAENAIVGEIGSCTDWSRALDGVEVVVHAAARAHVLHDSASNAPLYDEVNARGAQQLARCAVRAGVRRFVLLSSIKVNGEETGERPFTAEDTPEPQDAYGRSKQFAEQLVSEIARESNLEVAIVRPPLVYGTGVRANFLRLLGWVHAGRPLPLGAVHNRRSLVNLWNLCDLLRALAEHRAAGIETFLVSDGEDVSTPELVRRIATAMRREARLIPVPPSLLVLAGALLGKKDEVRRLCGSLQIDSQPVRSQIGWTPPVSMDDALRRTAGWYLAQCSERQ